MTGVDTASGGIAAVAVGAPATTTGDRSLVATPPHPACRVCVVVPVRDEAATLPAALAALAEQTDLAGRPLPRVGYEVIVLANNCRDDSAAVARAVADRSPGLRLHVVERTLPPMQAHVGWARRLAMEEACRRLGGLGRPRGVIASTDGDTRVAPTWLAATLREVAAGADAVGGRILVPRGVADPLDPATRAYHLRDVGYRLLAAELEAALDPDPADPWPRHHQHFGGSLAVTVAAYRRAGGLPNVPALEDVAFYDALRRIDARVRHSAAVRVVTSARRTGRVAIGLASQLGEWAGMAESGLPYLVESLPALEARLDARRRLRDLWRGQGVGTRPHPSDLAALAADLGLDADRLRDELALPRSFGRLDEWVTVHRERDGAWARRWPLEPIESAIADLRRRLVAVRRCRGASLRALQDVESVALLPPPLDVPQPRQSLVFPGHEGVVDLIAR